MDYRISQTRRTLATVFGIVLIIGGAALFLSPLYTPDPGMAGMSIFIGLPVCAAGLFLWRDTVKIRITINNTTITIQRALYQRVFTRQDVEGYREEKKVMYFVLKDGHKQLMIPAGLENINQLKDWIKENFKNADDVIIAEETKEIMANETFGYTADDRAAFLKKAKLYTRIVTVAWGVLAMWVLFYPHPFQIAWMALLPAPLIVVAVLWYFRGLVTLNESKASAYPSLLFVAVITAMAAGVRALIEYDLYAWDRIWGILAATTAILSGLLYFSAFSGIQKGANKTYMWPIATLLFAVFVFGAIVFINCYYDASRPQVFTLPVIDKHESQGKTTSYFITTPPWGRFTHDQNINVSWSRYNTTHLNDTVMIYLYKGNLNIPWYRVGDK